jgi:enamine deaminase RidA (YjgF/YER057c/UK114 family)
MRENISDHAPWESMVGYSRAVRIGNTLEISGTTATVKGEVVCRGDAAGQTRVILEKMVMVLKQANMDLSDIVRTRIYVVDIEAWKEIGAVHREFFGDIKPATTMVEVNRLIDDELLVEIEAVAVQSL